MERKNSIPIPSLQSGSHTPDLSPLPKRREDKERSRIISSFWLHLWLMDIGDGFQWATLEAKRLRGEGLLVKGRLRGSFKVAS